MTQAVEDREIQKCVSFGHSMEIREVVDGEHVKILTEITQIDEESKGRLEYLKCVFIKTCIQSMQSNTMGAWIHLTEILTLLRPFGEVLLEYGQILHYILRIYEFCRHHEDLNKLNVPSLLSDMFPTIDFDIAISTTISTLNSQSEIPRTSGKMKNIHDVSLIRIEKAPHVKDAFNIFEVHPFDLQGRIYQPEKLSVADIQRFLPRVTAGLARLESTWENALGLTVTTLNTALPQEPPLRRESPSPIVENEPSQMFDGVPVAKKPRTQSPKTGRDVIEYLVKSGRCKEIKIFYLNVVPSKSYNPYNLIKVTKKTIKKEHVVMSIFGVLHVRPNGNSNLTTVGQWYMEAAYFHTIKKISLFRNFSLIKALRKWKEHFKFSKFLAMRKKIKNTHLYAIPSLPKAISKINYLLTQMECVKLLSIGKQKRMTVDEYKDTIGLHLKFNGKILHHMYSMALDVINNCFTECYDYVKYCQDQYEAESQPQESMSVVRKRREKQVQNIKIAENNLTKLPTVRILVNSMIRSQVIQWLCKHINEFIYQELHSKAAGSFYCKTNISPSGVTFQPSEEELFDVIHHSIIDCLTKLETVYFRCLSDNSEADNCGVSLEISDRSINFERLKKILKSDSVVEEITKDDVESKAETQTSCTVLESTMNQEIVLSAFASLKESLAEAYSEAQEALSSFTWVKEVTDYISSWNAKEFTTETILQVLSIEKSITKMKVWQENLKKIHVQYVTKDRLLFFDMSSISKVVLPKLDVIFAEIIKISKAENAKKLQFLLDDLADLAKKLNDTPSNVEEFATYFLFVNRVQRKVPTLKEKLDIIKTLYELIKNCHHRQFTFAEERDEEKMLLLWEKFMFALQNGNNYLDVHVPSRVEQLRSGIETLLHKADSIVKISTSGEFLETKGSYGIILGKLKEHYEEFNLMYQKVQLYAKCLQKISGVPQDLSVLVDGQKRINRRYELWKFLEKSTQAIKEWKNAIFSKFQGSVQRVVEKVQNWKLAAQSLQEDIPKEDLVFAKWLLEIQDFSVNLEVLQDLSNPTMKIRHWKEMFVVLGQDFDSTFVYRVNDIVSMDIIDNMDKIHQISLAASAEHILKQHLHELIRKWRKKDFKFKRDHGCEKTKTRNTTRETDYDTLKLPLVLTGVDELINQVEDSLLILQSMLMSHHVTEVKDLVIHWDSELQETKCILEAWMLAQQQWIYLGHIFSYKTAEENHPSEFKIFIQNDTFFRELMDITLSDAKVLYILDKKHGLKGWREYQGAKLKELLKQAIEQQATAILGLNMYVCKMRASFPRLFLWSDEELIQLLTITRNTSALVPVVQKCFPGVFDVKFEMPADGVENVMMTSLDSVLNAHLAEATAIFGSMDEELSLGVNLPSDLAITDWLNLMEATIKEATKADLKNCLVGMKKDYGEQMDIEQWCTDNIHRKYSFQTLLLHYDIALSALLQNLSPLSPNSFDEVRKNIERDVSNLSIFLRTSNTWSFRNKTDQRCLLYVQTLLSKAIHFRDCLSGLQFSNENSFEWLQMVRYDCNSMNDQQDDLQVNVSCFGYNFDYAYEYYAPSEQLVCTPLTDRCVYAILIAIRQYQAGCLYGADSSGKSLVCNHVAKILGRHFVTLKCSLEMSVDCVARFVLGALQVGSLLCLDKIHQLPVEVLSMVGKFFQDIRDGLLNSLDGEHIVIQCHWQHGLKLPHGIDSLIKDDHLSGLSLLDVAVSSKNDNICGGNNRVVCDGKSLQVNPHFGCVFTANYDVMNWRKVPDNLRRNFHSIAMMKPNVKFLFEIWLLMHGFHKFVGLSVKLAVFVDVCRSENQSSFCSLGKIRAAIEIAGRAIRIEKVQKDHETRQLTKAIVAVLQHSLDNGAFTKLLLHMQAIFCIAKETFNVTPSCDYMLLDAIKEEMQSNNLYPKRQFVNQIIQLHKLLTRNQSVILYGPNASGKTTCYKTLAHVLCQYHSPWSQQPVTDVEANSRHFTRVDLKIVYPNVMDYSQLYGKMDPSIKQWTDGLLTKILHTYPSSKSSTASLTSAGDVNSVQSWLVLDGAFNEEWITSVEALLDQQNTLTLKNGKEVFLRESSRILFEVESLAHCSPSLLTRSSLLYFQRKLVLDWNCYFHTWKMSAHCSYQLKLESFVIIEECLDYTLVPTIKFIEQECDCLLTGDVHSKQTTRDQNAKEKTYIVQCTHILNILASLFHHWISRDHSPPMVSLDTKDDDFITKFVCNALAYAFAHGISALVHARSYSKLDIFVRQIFCTCPPCSVIFPANFVDCYFDGNMGELVPWNEQRAQKRIPTTSSAFTVTREIQQCYVLTELLLTSQANCLILGDLASGKTSFVKSLVNVKFPFTKIQASQRLDTHHFQKRLLDKLNYIKSLQTTNAMLKNARIIESVNMLFFIDDLNLAVKRENGRHQPIYEFVRQLNSEGGCYDLTGSYFNYIPALQILAAYTLPSSDEPSLSAQSYMLTSKFMRQFSIVKYPSLSSKALVTIFSRTCQSWLSRFDWLPWKQDFSKAIVVSTMSIHDQLGELYSTWSNPIYKFSLHDLSKLFRNLITFKPVISKTELKVLCNTDFKLLFPADGEHQIVVHKSNSEFSMKPSNASVNAAELLKNPIKQVLTAWRTELAYIYGSRLPCRQTNEKLNDFTYHSLVDNFKCFVNEDLTKSDAETQQLDGLDDLPVQFMRTLYNNKDEIHQPTSYDLHSLNSDGSTLTYKRVAKKIFETAVTDAFSKLDLTIFIHEEILQHVSNLMKTMGIPRGHAFLVSCDGHGRRNVIRVVGHLMNMQLFELRNNENEFDLRTTIKDACNVAGLSGRPVILFAVDMLPQEIYKDMTALITDGVCPGLYTHNELLLTVTQLSPGAHLNMRHCNRYAHHEERFFQRIKSNLHIVICKSHHQVRDYLQSFPMSLYKVTCVDVYKEYSVSVWRDFAEQWLSKHNFTGDIDNEEISTLLAELHYITNRFVRQHYDWKQKKIISTFKFFECLQIFHKLYELTYSKAKSRFDYLNITKLKTDEAHAEISNYMREVERLTLLLHDAEETVKVIKVDLKNIGEELATVKKQCDDQCRKEEELRVPLLILKKQTEDSFAKLSPLYEAAVSALNALDYHAVDELKSYHTPPVGVVVITKMLCTLFNVPSQTWEDARLLLMRDNFLQDLRYFDKDHISYATYKKLSEFVRNPTLKHVANVSQSADQIRIWLNAIHSYAKILRQLQPKRDAYNSAEKIIMKAEKELSVMKLQYDKTKARFDEQTNMLNDELANIKTLEFQIKTIEESKDHIENLLDTMSPFTEEWERELNGLLEAIQSMPRDCLFMAARVVYVRVHPISVQQQIEELWTSRISGRKSSRLALNSLFTTEDECSEWARQMDVSNTMLVDNLLAIRVVVQSSEKCWPLMTDPRCVAESYVALLEGLKHINQSTHNITSASSQVQVDGNILIVNASDPALNEVILRALREGLVLLVKNVEQAHSSALLNSVLSRDQLIDGNITYGKQPVEYNSRFRLYLSTSLTLTGLLEEELNHLLDRAITFNMEANESALTRTFLKSVLSKKAPELRGCQRQGEFDLRFLKRKKKSTLEVVLRKVVESELRLFEEEELLQYISFQRENLWLTQEKIIDAQYSLSNISTQRKPYLSLATFMTAVWRILHNISNMNSFYHVTMEMMEEVLVIGLQNGHMVIPAANDTDAYVEEIKKLFAKEMFNRSCSILFQEHNLSFPICLALEQMNFDLDVSELSEIMDRFLLLNDGCHGGVLTNKRPDWISETSWKNLVVLSRNVAKFNNLINSLQRRSMEWQEYFLARTSSMRIPYLLPELNKLEVAMLWVAYDRNKLPSICQELALCQLGPDYLDVPAFKFSMEGTYPYYVQIIALPNNSVPIVEDPCSMLSEIAKHHEIPEVTTVCMADNQEQFLLAENAVGTAATRGGWVVLLNCHMVKNWSKNFLVCLETCLQAFRAKDLSPAKENFRVWMVLRWSETLHLPERIMNICQVLAWQPLQGKDKMTILFRNSKENEENLITCFSEEVQKSRYYSLPYQLQTNREYDMMLELAKKFTNNNNEISTRGIKNTIFLPQLANYYDEKIYWKKKTVSHIMGSETKLDSVDGYFEMLRRYFSKKMNDVPLIAAEEVESLLQQFIIMKENCIYEMHTRLVRPFIFSAVYEEILHCELTIGIIIMDLMFLKRVLIRKCPPTEHTSAIHRALSNGKAPVQWCRERTESSEATLCDILLVEIIQLINDKLSHFNNLINTSPSEHIEVQLNLFSSPMRILNAMKLQQNADSNSIVSSLSAKPLMARIVTNENNTSCEENQSPFLIKNLTVYKISSGRDKTIIPLLAIHPDLDYMITERTEVFHTEGAIKSHVLTLVPAKDDEFLMGNDILNLCSTII